jgi:tetratricopeptide (TPR) repeat protein
MVLGVKQVLVKILAPVRCAQILPVVVCLICLFFSAQTWSRAGDYASGMQIWRSAIAENPDNDRAMQALIGLKRLESPPSSALPALAEALRVAEQTNVVPTVALGRLGEQYVEQGQSERAINLLKRAIRLDEQHFSEGYRGARRNKERAGIHVNMGLALASMGELSGAVEQVNEAFLFADGSADARALAGSLSLQVGDIEAANDHFQRALELRPGWKDVEADLERIRQLQ